MKWWRDPRYELEPRTFCAWVALIFIYFVIKSWLKCSEKEMAVIFGVDDK